MAKEIPVYLFSGFLDSGKTKFIQETLEDPRFNHGERTLLLVCEEGEEEYDPSRFHDSKNVFMQTVDSLERINPVDLQLMAQRTRCDRVIVEYNGMWLLDDFYAAMPDGWIIYQEFCFAEASSFVMYNTNMRQLVYDKLKSCELVVFNRYTPDIDKMELHKIVRGVSRRTDIAYEAPSGEVHYDEIEDPLPFDVNAPVITIKDDDYAIWFRDLNEEMDKYEGKEVCFKGYVIRSQKLPVRTFLAGRYIMTCCEADIQFYGLACEGKEPLPTHKGWSFVKGVIHIRRHKAYGDEKGPVIEVRQVSPAVKPEQEVATFY